MNLEILRARVASLEARAELDADVENPNDVEKRSMDADTKELEVLKAEVLKLETKPDDVEEVARRHKDLTSRVELRSYLKAYSDGKSLAGGSAEAELNQELKLDNDTIVPWESFAAPEPEKRADTVTNLGAGNYAVQTDPMLGRIFSGSESEFLGVSFVPVPSGQRTFPILLTGASGGMKAQSAAQDAEAFTVGTLDMNPTRASAGYNFDGESLAFFGAELETALQADLRSVIQNLMDNQILLGSGAAPQVDGLLHRLTTPGNPGAQSAFADYVTAVSGAVDGKTATSESEVRMLVGPATWKHARSKVLSNTAIDAIGGMVSLGAAVRVSSRIPAVTSKRQDAIRLSNGANGSLVAPVWGGGPAVLRDPYTDSAKNQVILRIHVLFNFGSKRLDGISQVRFQVAA